MPNSKRIDPNELLEQLKNCQQELDENRRQQERTSKVQSALYRIATQASSAQSMAEFYSGLHQILSELMVTRNLYIFLYDAKREWRETAYFVDQAGDQPPAPGHLPASPRSLVRYTLDRGEIVHLSRSEILQLVDSGAAQVFGTMAEDWVGVPLKLENQTIGILVLQSYDQGMRYTDQDVEILAFVAQHIASAHSRAQAIEETRQKNAELAIINTVQTALASKLDFNSIVELVGQNISAIFPEEEVSVGFFDEARSVMVVPYLNERGVRSSTEFPFDPSEKSIIARVYRTREPLLIGANFRSVSQEMGETISSENPLPKSWLSVPIVTGEHVVGGIVLQNYAVEFAYTQSDVRLLQTLASSMGAALENARLFEELQQRNQEISDALEREKATSDILQIIASTPNEVQPALDAIARSAVEIAGIDDAVISLVEGNFYVGVAHFGSLPMFVGEDRVPLDRETISGKSILDNQPVQVYDLSADDGNDFPVGQQYARDYGYRSTFAAPLRREGVAFGCILIRGFEAGFLSQKQIEILVRFADQAVIAIENVRLFTETQRLLKVSEQRTAELTIINSVQQGLVSKLDYRAIIDLVGDKVREALHAEGVGIAIYDRQKNLVNFPYIWENGRKLSEDWQELDQGFIHYVITRRQPLLINEKMSEHMEEYGSRLFFGKLRTPKSKVAVPIQSGEDVIGVLTIEDFEKEQAYSDSDVRLLLTLASSMGIALENARLFNETQQLLQETQQRAAELSLINAVQTAIVSKVEFDRIIEVVGERISGIFPHETVAIGIIDRRREVVNVPYINEGGRRYSGEIPFGKGLAAVLHEKGEPLLIENDFLRRSQELGAVNIGEDTNPKSWLGVPIISNEQVIGGLSLQNMEREFAYTQSDVRLLQTLASSMGTALENARLFEELQKRTFEISETLDREKATNEILRLIAGAPTEVQPALDAIAESAVRIGGVDDAVIALVDGEVLRFVAHHGPIPMYGYDDSLKLDRGSVSGRSVLESRSIQILDLSDPAVTEYPTGQPGAIKFGYRTIFATPLCRDGAAFGTIIIRRKDALLLTEKQVDILNTFADQAVIAIENARLFDELQKRTQEIAKALEREKSTSEILRIIASSPTEVQPALDAIAKSAAEIAGVDDALIAIVDDDELQVVAHYGPIPMITVGDSVPFNRETVAGRAILENRPVQVFDLTGAEGDEFPTGQQVARTYGYRTTFSSPLHRKGEPFGCITIRRMDAQLLTEEQIDILQSFADQAVIAIENVRLFSETQRLLKETAQRAAELSIINSVGEAMARNLDVKTVTHIVGDRLREIFKADMVDISLYDASTNLISAKYIYCDGYGDAENEPPWSADEGLTGHVISTRLPLLINTRAELGGLKPSTYFIAQPGTPDPESFLGMPIIVGDKVIGVVDVQNYRRNAFTQNDLNLLLTLTTNMGVALENARLFEEVQQRSQEISESLDREKSTSEILRIIASSPTEFQPALDAIAEAAVKIGGVDDAMIGLVDGDQVRFYAHHGPIPSFPVEVGLPLDRGSVTGRSILDNEPVQVLDLSDAYVTEFPTGQPGAIKFGERTVFATPLLREGTAIGSIVIRRKEARLLTSKQVEILNSFADQAVIAIENVRLFNETRRLLTETEQRNSELSLINSIQKGLGEKLNFQDIIELVGEKIQEIFSVSEVEIAIFEAETQMISFPYWSSSRGRIKADSIPIGQGLNSIIIEKKAPLLLTSAAQIKALGAVIPKGFKHRKSFVGVPILTEKGVIGAISLHDEFSENAYNQNQVRLLQTLAASMGVTLENARLFEQTQILLKNTEQHAREMDTVNTVSQALVSEIELEALIQLAGEQIRHIFDVDIVYLALLDRQTNLINFPYQVGEQFTTLQFGEGMASKVLETGQPMLINYNVDDRRKEMGVGYIGRPALSYLAVPIKVGKDTIGVISVQDTHEEGRFNASDMRLLTTIAANVGTAIRNANLFDEARRSRQYYEAVILNSPVAIITENHQMRVTGWNPGAENLFRYTASEALGKDLDDLVAITPELHAEALQFSNQLLQEGSFHGIARRTRKDGSLMDVEISGLPITVDKEIIGYVYIYHDITELQRAREEAIAANKAKSAFLANMSHELRTPLNAIIGFTRIVRRKGEDTLPPRQLENLDKVLVSADHLLGLINTVLDISKIEAGRMEVQPSTFHLRPLIELVTASSQPLLKPDVRLESKISPKLPDLYSDQGMLKQVLINLLSNAAKFTHQGKISLQARAVGADLLVEVQDTGIGIPAEAQQRIFDEFQQVDSSTTRVYGGTGLGLAISRRLARLLGGDLTVASQEGSGSTFTLSIPLRYGTSPVESSSSEELAMQPGANRQPLILAIDDNPDVHQLLKENLSEAGYRLATAVDGDEGLQKARELQPFAITLDIMLPRKDGWQVLHELKSDPLTSKIPVILHTIIDKQALGFRLGAADYLVKPLDENALLAALQRLANRRQLAPPHRLLVVDDDPNVPDLVRQMLDPAAFEIQSARDGWQALEIIQQIRPDVILLDLVMPELDGFGLLEKIAQAGDLKDTPVIVLTSRNLSSADRELLNERVVAIIQKNGIDSELLVKEIQAVLPVLGRSQV